MLMTSLSPAGPRRNAQSSRLPVLPRTVAEAGANIEEVHHQRAFTLLAAQNVEIEFVLQTRNQAHVEQVLQALQAQGMEAARM